ncbi:tRNA (N(6)-L-threonylcarbamoyladenosine(37)-C(2))-methylthiotransferase MtaB [Dehalogenimonas formicexedens]|uniref:tRNA (N(6)-L-threonylcarbamoyladenosine(37)-C(2))- methylthiotransferase MtaB n=1 Tax=Dehalogenimonas formicexedens TaxID=1839801 RepID=UPI00096B93D1|nr:tRNA (N(6)-L-threonylcarbamoyladenosine(37)-C(2))-methylthiotransferase MtaB [Dehalogenimonas formicexedens]
MVTVYIETLGCKLNQAESEVMRRDLAAAGYRIVQAVDNADVLLLNTCTVTGVADRKAMQAVRSAIKANARLKVIITGCYVERDAETLTKLPGILATLGNDAKNNIASEFERLGFAPSEVPFEAEAGRTRSMVKIQDGCDHRCSYCVVPLVRSLKSCVPAGTIVEQIKARQAEGFREVVLTGTEIGEYACDGLDLAGLLKRILLETGIERIRISSLQPQEVTPELIRLWDNPRLCRHFHLSLQSGSDAVLGRMRRRYNTAGYLSAVKLIRDIVPEAAVTTDIIAGFPGETDAEFEDSFRFIEQIGFSRLHVFPYSPRPGTLAASMPDQVEHSAVKPRVARLLKLGRQCEAWFKGKFKGQFLEVLVEAREEGRWVGYTDNYIRVSVDSDEDLENRIVPIKL